MQPRIKFHRTHAEGYRCKELRRVDLALVVVGRVVPHFHSTPTHGVEYLERRNKFATAIDFDPEATARHRLQSLGELFDAHSHARKFGRP